ncbi:MAG: glutaredoxin domain-containing protein [Gammaproteobacteria bacterium]
MTAVVRVYSTAKCPMCQRAKQLLEKWNIPFTIIMVDTDRKGLIEMARLTNGARTVPQIVIEGQWIGSLSELTEYHMDGKLDDFIIK